MVIHGCAWLCMVVSGPCVCIWLCVAEHSCAKLGVSMCVYVCRYLFVTVCQACVWHVWIFEWVVGGGVRHGWIYVNGCVWACTDSSRQDNKPPHATYTFLSHNVCNY